MIRIATLALTVAGLAAAQADGQTLLAARQGFETRLLRPHADNEPLPEPPADLFTLETYPGPLGELRGYVSKPPSGGATSRGRLPAMLWITGGFPPGGIGSDAWEPVGQSDDQSAKAYREAGLVMIYPTMRGSAGNAGVQEGFYGEVDDVLAALEYARGLDFVDPERIYLGGHSTGGTLALLVAAATDRFRAIFAFGPVEDPAGYGEDCVPYDLDDDKECALRAPIRFLGAIRSPTFVIEGAVDSNLDSLQAMQKACGNDAVRFLTIEGADHFDVLGPANRVIAARLVKLGSTGPIELTADEIAAAVAAQRVADREAEDLSSLAELRAAGVAFDEPRLVRFLLFADQESPLNDLADAADGFAKVELTRGTNRSGDTFYALVLTRRLTLRKFEDLFAASAAIDRLATRHDAYYGSFTVR